MIHRLLLAAATLWVGCRTSAPVVAPPPDTRRVATVSDAICTTAQTEAYAVSRSHTLGATLRDLRGACVHEFRVNKSVAPWVPMRAWEQNFCGSIEDYKAGNSTVGGIFDRDNDVNIYVEASPGPSKDLYDEAIAIWDATPEFAEMEVTVPEPLRTGNAFFPQPWAQGRLDHMLSGPHCFYGPWVADNSHPGGPAHAEIHPVKASWWRDQGNLMVFSIQDESARFDQCISYQPISNPLCRVAQDQRADCFVADGHRIEGWGREWTRGPLEMRMRYLVDIATAERPKVLFIDPLSEREVVTEDVAESVDGPSHFLLHADGDTLLAVLEDPNKDGLFAVRFDTVSSCWSSDRDSLRAVVDVTWALGEEAKWHYGIERGWNWWAPNPQSGRGYVVFRLREAPATTPAIAMGMSRGLTRGLSQAETDSLRARLLGMKIRWEEVDGIRMPVADISITSNLKEEYGEQRIEPTIRGLRGIDAPDNVSAEPDSAGVLTIRNVPLLFGGSLRLAPADSTAPDTLDGGLNISLPSYRMAAAVLDAMPIAFAAGEDTQAWAAFQQATGGEGSGSVPGPSFGRVAAWRIVTQTRLVPLLEDLEVDVRRWRNVVPEPVDGELTLPPEQPFPDLTSEVVWRVEATDVAADSALAVAEQPEEADVSYATDIPGASLNRITINMETAPRPLTRVTAEYDASDTFGHRSIGDITVHSLAFAHEDRDVLVRDVIAAAAAVEGRIQTPWVRGAVEYARNGEVEAMTGRSESLVILAGTLAEDGFVDVEEFARLRAAIRGPSR